MDVVVQQSAAIQKVTFGELRKFQEKIELTRHVLTQQYENQLQLNVKQSALEGALAA